MVFYFKASIANSWIRVIICPLIPLLFYNKRRNRRFIKHQFDPRKYLGPARDEMKKLYMHKIINSNY